MSTDFKSSVAEWLCFEAVEADLYKTTFQNHHLGNIFIKSIHGGVTGALIEMAAEHTTRAEAGSDTELMIASVSTDYLRVTKDIDLYARTKILRISRRLSVIDVICWQDSEDVPIARGVVTLKITASEAA